MQSWKNFTTIWREDRYEFECHVTSFCSLLCLHLQYGSEICLQSFWEIL